MTAEEILQSKDISFNEATNVFFSNMDTTGSVVFVIFLAIITIASIITLIEGTDAVFGFVIMILLFIVVVIVYTSDEGYKIHEKQWKKEAEEYFLQKEKPKEAPIEYLSVYNKKDYEPFKGSLKGKESEVVIVKFKDTKEHTIVLQAEAIIEKGAKEDTVQYQYVPEDISSKLKKGSYNPVLHVTKETYEKLKEHQK